MMRSKTDQPGIIFLLITTVFFSWPTLAFERPTLHAGNPATNNQYTCVAAGSLTCYENLSGNKLWENPAIQDARGLILTHNYLYLTQHKDARIFNASDGTLINVFKHQSTLFDPVITSKYLILSDHQGGISVIDIDDASLVWQRRIDSGWLYPPSVYKNMLFTGGQSGTLWALNIDNGESLWHKKLKQELVYSPVISGESLIVSTFDGVIQNLQPQDGQLIWQQSLSSPLIHIQTENPDKFIASAFDGKLYAIQTLSGKLLWQIQAHSSARFNYFTNTEYIASIDYLGQFKLFDQHTGRLLRTSNFEGRHQVAPLMKHSTIWLFADNRPVQKLTLGNNHKIQ